MTWLFAGHSRQPGLNSSTRMAAARVSAFVSLSGPSSTNNLAGFDGKALARCKPAGKIAVGIATRQNEANFRYCDAQDL
jgi:hypothetical protein